MKPHNALQVPRPGETSGCAARWLSFAVCLCSLAWLSRAHAQAPILAYDFEDGKLDDFFNPSGTSALDVCGSIAPAGTARVDSGEVVLENDAVYGITVLLLRPEKVARAFPTKSRDYTVRLRVWLGEVTQFSLFVRSRIGVRYPRNQIDLSLERVYSVSIFSEGIQPLYPNGMLGIAEFTSCHDLVPHPEWPGGTDEGFACAEPDFPITLADWYWLEATVQGNDQGGPVLIAAKLWPDGESPPDAHLLIVTDENGLPHTPATLDPATECQVAIGTSIDNGQQPLATCRFDDLSIFPVTGCTEPPIRARRKLWAGPVFAQGKEAVLYESGKKYDVRIELTNPRAAGVCPAPGGVRIVEVLPQGWIAGTASHGGDIQGNVIVWDIPGPLGPTTLSYTATAGDEKIGYFLGEVIEKDATRIFLVEGADFAVTEEILPPVSDFGTIQHWLILGPFTRKVAGANPGSAEIAKDYLTDGVVRETEIQPRAGDQILPDYGKKAASTGLAQDDFGRNVGGMPTWIEWRDFDDADDRIDFEHVYGARNDVMCYALTYLNVLEDVTVNFGISSDDSIQVLLDGRSIHLNNVARGALGRTFQDTPVNFPNLGKIPLTARLHVLLVKVFEGGGEHNFRVGFVDEFGIEIPGGLPEIEILLAPPSEPQKPKFRRGDPNDDGQLNISDGIFSLNWLFLGGGAPNCTDAADTNDDGEVNISDPISLLNYLFLGGPTPPLPGPDCGEDPTEDTLGECGYANCP